MITPQSFVATLTGFSSAIWSYVGDALVTCTHYSERLSSVELVAELDFLRRVATMPLSFTGRSWYLAAPDALVTGLMRSARHSRRQSRIALHNRMKDIRSESGSEHSSTDSSSPTSPDTKGLIKISAHDCELAVLTFERINSKRSQHSPR